MSIAVSLPLCLFVRRQLLTCLRLRFALCVQVMLRESFAHPGVEGVMLWGFWEGALSRENAHLVDSDKRVNAAGKRLIALREEWTTSLHGGTEENGQFSYRGYLGSYTAYVDFGQGEVPLEFEVTKGSDPQVIDLIL